MHQPCIGPFLSTQSHLPSRRCLDTHFTGYTKKTSPRLYVATSLFWQLKFAEVHEGSDLKSQRHFHHKLVITISTFRQLILCQLPAVTLEVIMLPPSSCAIFYHVAVTTVTLEVTFQPLEYGLLGWIKAACVGGGSWGLLQSPPPRHDACTPAYMCVH